MQILPEITTEEKVCHYLQNVSCDYKQDGFLIKKKQNTTLNDTAPIDIIDFETVTNPTNHVSSSNTLQNDEFLFEKNSTTLSDTTQTDSIDCVIVKIPINYMSYEHTLKKDECLFTKNKNNFLENTPMPESINPETIIPETDTDSSDYEYKKYILDDTALSDSVLEIEIEPSEYVPSSNDSEYERSSNDSEKNICKESTSPICHLKINSESKKDLCPLCFEEVGHFSRHLQRKHSDEEAIKKIITLPIKSQKRRDAILALRKKGNFVLKQQKDKLVPVRRPNNKKCENQNEIYFPCVNCLGYYKKTYLWRHRKKCSAKTTKESGSSKTNHLSEAQTFLASIGMLGNYLNKSRLKKEVLGIMRPDEISFVAKNDALICMYGESYLNKHKRRQMNVVVSSKMRELARLKLALQKSTTITNLIEILKPEMYNQIIAACKIICGYDPTTQTMKASSLALHLGTTLKFLCDVAKKAVVTNDPLFAHLNKSEIKKNIFDLRDMIQSHWCNDISSIANKILNENKWDKPKLLPLTEDIKQFNNHIVTLALDAFKKLKDLQDIQENYKLLSECTLCLVLVFNRKRIGEIQFLDIQTYEKNFSTVNQEECLSALSDFERSMSFSFKRVVVFGKGSKPVPILFTKQMQSFIELLLKTRRTTDIVPKSNKYIFANPGSLDRWLNGAFVLRKYAYNCGAKNPELLTSTRFRKQIATILQLMSFEDSEMEQIARFLGHTEKTHREFYR